MLRNEIKYLLNYEDYLVLSKRIAAVLPSDKHTVSPEGYRITSLYLDDNKDTSYYEKLSGDANRKKYRIRAYNYDPSFIALECKEKKLNKINKTSFRIDKEIFDSMKSNDFSPLAEKENDLCKRVFLLNRDKGLSPVVTVDYVREAYLHPLSNTRITFDKELSCGITTNDFFSKEYKNGYVFGRNEVILEVKFDNFLPEYIRQLLSIGYTPMAASKYMLCRDYLKNNIKLIQK